jgi:hypothetical protein
LRMKIVVGEGCLSKINSSWCTQRRARCGHNQKTLRLKILYSIRNTVVGGSGELRSPDTANNQYTACIEEHLLITIAVSYYRNDPLATNWRKSCRKLNERMESLRWYGSD